MSTQEKILETLKQVPYPGFSRDIVSFGLVKEVAFDNGQAVIRMAITTQDAGIPTKIKESVEAAVAKVDGVDKVEAQIAVSQPSGATAAEPEPKLQQVKTVIAVASGKGGVGKSTVSVNLACALSAVLGKEHDRPDRVGILDCDIYGPSVPQMLGINQQPEIINDMIMPIHNFGVRAMSMGFLIDENTPVVWRGPMVNKTIQQFASNVEWGELDFLIVDLPPGTGDAQLSLVQNIPLQGAIIVTTPQSLAYNVARRGAMMFEKVNVPLLGVVENMSYLENPATGERDYIFGKGGGEDTARRLETEFLGQIPIDTRIRVGGDKGIPIVLSDPDGPATQACYKIARNLISMTYA